MKNQDVIHNSKFPTTVREQLASVFLEERSDIVANDDCRKFVVKPGSKNERYKKKKSITTKPRRKSITPIPYLQM